MSYDHVIGFYLHVKYREQEEAELIYLDRQSLLTLPVSKKDYKTTLRNVKTYCKELLTNNNSIKDITIDVMRRHGRVTR